MHRMTSIFTACALAGLLFAGGTATAKDGWVSLFDGKTLDGWTQRGGVAKYTVENGAIVGRTVLDTPNSFLCTNRNYADFELELEFLVDPKLNSGVQIRSNSYPAYRKGRVHGYQVEIDPSARAWSAGIYDEARRGWLNDLKDNEKARQAFKQNEWNHYRVLAVGDSIKTWINGVPAADLRDKMTASGFIALQVHGAKTAGLAVSWRNIRLREIDTPKPSYKALIIDGRNNHNWREGTPIIKEILEDAGIFTVDVATAPKDISQYKPDFAEYDVIVSNYNGEEWLPEVKAAFVKYMSEGGGLVTVHAADNSFPKWQEYNEMIGVGGWGGRNEKSGPMLHWEKGKIVRDNSPGRGGTHGPQHEFQLTLRDPIHPIVAGLPEVWLHTQDELYSKMRGPAVNLKVLATAYADPKKRGTGRHEPQLMAIRFGKGRIFHNMLGHDGKGLRCAGFAYVLQRGTEWAASERVTLTELPAGFPTADRSRKWIPGNIFGAIQTYDFGGDRQPLAAIEEMTRGASPARLAEIEEHLIAALKSPRTKYAGKQFVVRVLRRIGTGRCVPALAALLTDEKLSHNARWALQLLPGPEATKALLDAVGKTSGNLRVGIVGSLGDRRDPCVIDTLARFVSSGDDALAKAAIRSLGTVGGEVAAHTLATAKVAPPRRHIRDDAVLRCAESLVKAGNKKAAGKWFGTLATDPLATTMVRLAAFRGILQAKGAEGVPTVVALLDNSEPALQQGARKLLASVPGEDVTRALAVALGKQAKPANQVAIIAALVAREDKTAYSALAVASESADMSVQVAAVRALGVLGDAKTVKRLTPLLTRDDELGAAAFESLTTLSGNDVAGAIVALTRSESTALRIKAIQALVARHERGVVPSLLEVARGSKGDVRGAAIDAIGALSTCQGLNRFAALLVESSDRADRERIAAALRSITGRQKTHLDEVSNMLVGALKNADDEAKVLLLGVLPVLSADTGLAAVRGAFESKNAAVADAAVRAMAAWRNPMPLAELLTIANQPGPKERQSVAMEGYVRMLSMPSDRPAVQTVELLDKALGITKDVNEKRRILARLSDFPCREALVLAEKFEKDEALGKVASESAQKIRGILIANSLVATASHNSGDTRRAFDKDLGSRWATNTPMKPGMWFMVDLGSAQTVTRILLDSRNSPGDYPRGCEVYISADGKSWGDPVLTSPPQRPITRLVLPKPTKGRFVKIVQTGETQGLFWSIHEMRIGLE